MSGLEFDDEMRAKINEKLPKVITKKERRLLQEQFSYDEEQKQYVLAEKIANPISEILVKPEIKEAQSFGSPLKLFIDRIHTRISHEYTASYEPSAKKYLFLRLSQNKAIAFDCNYRHSPITYEATRLEREFNGWGPFISHVWVEEDQTGNKLSFKNEDELFDYIKPILAEAISQNINDKPERVVKRFSKLGAFAVAAGLLYSCSSDAAELPERNTFNTDPETSITLEP